MTPSPSDAKPASRLASQLAPLVEERAGSTSCLVVGICGPQGSGKSTLAEALAKELAARQLPTAVLSIDDFYLSRAKRAELAERVHPLFRTRGVPGTHDVELGVGTLAALCEPGDVSLPSFDKARDDVRNRVEWPLLRAPVRVVLFEGWCVGASPQSEQALSTPVNALESEEDPEGVWRRAVNDALAGAYRGWFDWIDLLILLRAPSFDVVFEWRRQQEQELRARVETEGGDPSRIMSDAALRRFISHYERLTRHILDEMPARADVLVELDPDRRARIRD